MLPKWVWSHDSEPCTEENYDKVVMSTENDVLGYDDESIDANYPQGYKFEPWSIEQIIEDKRNGRETALGAGEWMG
jgi:hypothetical protein